MNCKHCRSLLDELPLPEWPPSQLESVREHARHCPDCEALLAQEERWISEWQRAPDPEPPAELLESIMARTAFIDQQAKRTANKSPGTPDSVSASDGRLWLILAGFVLGLGVYLFQVSTGQLGLEFFSVGLPQWGRESSLLEILGPMPLIVTLSLTLFVIGFFSLLHFDAAKSGNSTSTAKNP